MSYDCCIIGAGATGLSLLLLLQDAGYPLERVCIVDPYFDGGDLTRRWTSVLSNTPWSKTLVALAECAPSIPLPQQPNPDASCPLSELGGMLRTLAAGGAFRRVGIFQGLATQAEFTDTTGLWSVLVEGGPGSHGSPQQPLEAKVLVLATGSDPRSLGLPLPSIPLEIALDAQRLRHYVKPGQRVLQFGTMHSGCLVLRNLIQDCSAGFVSAVYKGGAPFVWDRDGAYDGIKREAADIADSVIKGREGGGGSSEYSKGRLELVPLEDTSGVIRASLRADWVVYATGFQRRRGPSLLRNGTAVKSDEYDGATGALLPQQSPFAWGFGIAYPNRAPDGVHWDVSVAAFLLHMKRNLPALMEQMRRRVEP